MALQHPQISVVARDEPALLESVRATVEQFDLTKRIKLCSSAEDAHELIPESFSMIIVSHACRFLGMQKSQGTFPTMLSTAESQEASSSLWMSYPPTSAQAPLLHWSFN